MQAALLGAKEIGFTVLSISISLVAVFIPILLMGGHRRPAVPRVCRHAVGGDRRVAGRLADHHADDVRQAAQATARGASRRLYRASEWVFDWILRRYENSLAVVLRHRFITLLVTLGTIALTVYLYRHHPEGLLPAAGHRAA